MPGATRKGDRTKGICDPKLPCCPHSRRGTNEEVSEDVIINDLGAHRETDEGPCNCPHAGRFKSIEGSPDVLVNDLPQTRIGDETKCKKCGLKGVHVTGSDDVIVN